MACIPWRYGELAGLLGTAHGAWVGVHRDEQRPGLQPLGCARLERAAVFVVVSLWAPSAGSQAPFEIQPLLAML